MLRKVILLIKEDIFRKKILCGESILIDDLREHGVEVENGYDAVTEKLLKIHGAEISVGLGIHDDHQPEDEYIQPDMTQIEDALYITDSETEYQTLKQQGKYVLPYRHEENTGAVYPGALYVIEQIEEMDFDAIDMVYRRLAGLPLEILTTKRCVIRETTVEDVDSFYPIYAEPEMTEYMEDLYEDRDAEIAYIKDYREKVYGFYGYGMWTVLTKEGTVIGRAGISWREGFDIPELGFMIGVPWQRQGYAYEVCSAILDYAYEELGFTQVQALVMEGNEKSAALCRKLGFKRNGSVVLEKEIYAVYLYSVMQF